MEYYEEAKKFALFSSAQKIFIHKGYDMNAVIYARYSSDSQREESIEGQIRECTEYAQRNGITVLGTYIDRALSASKETEKRLEFQRMVHDSANEAFDTVLVWKLDRFARSRYDSALYKNILAKNGVRVISATEHIADSPEGIILESLLEGMAEYYSAELSEKIHRGQKENALKGKNNGGSIPLGYVLGDDQRLAVDPMTAPLIPEIYQRFAEGETLRSIVKSLNDRGFRTTRNKPFTINSLTTVLRNRKYIGEYKYQDVVIPGGVPALVSEDLFQRVQQRIERNKHAPAASKAKTEYLLTGKLFCGHCGTTMIGESGVSRRKQTYFYYKCRSAKKNTGCHKKAIRKDLIERLVVEQTVCTVLVDSVIERIASTIYLLQGKENTVLPALRQQLAETEKRIENMVSAIEQGIITRTTKQRLEELEAQKSELEISILQAQLENPVLTYEQILYGISRYKGGRVDDPVYQRRIIDNFVNSVYLYDDKLVLTFNYRDSTKTVSLAEVQGYLKNVIGSDLEGFGPPEKTLAFQWMPRFFLYT